MKIYIIGSLRNPRVPEIANALRGPGRHVFDDWYAAGPEADDYWQKYSQARGQTYLAALNDHAAQHVFNFDLTHLDESDVGVLVYPAGKSGHLELGYLRGQGKPCFILLDKEPERWDVMANFAIVCAGVGDLMEELEAIS